MRDGSVARSALMEKSALVNHLYVIVLTLKRDGYQVQKISDTLWLIPTNSGFSLWKMFDAMKIARQELFFQGRLQVDLVSAEDPMGAGLVGYYIGKKYGKPLHVEVMENIFSKYYVSLSYGHLMWSLIARFVVKKASAIRVGSEYIGNALAEVGTSVADKIVLLPQRIDIASFEQEPIRVNIATKYPQFKFIILMVAPLNQSQNLHLAITALAQVIQKYSHVGLVI
ncbi:MAG: cap, capsular polysaccharide biosynthsis protein, partial [Candidatus Adlerbacteria bacterium]|nr:cap, capsular polysaccharide biosynthsis protein [Candidatus Adlerbacteria bacterium]